MVRSLELAGLRTVGDLARTEPRALADRFGAYGLRLSQLAQGQDARAVDPDSERKSVSAETTFDEDHADRQALEDRLWPLCEKVARICRRNGIAGRVVVLKLRKTDFNIVTRRRTLAVPTQTARVLFQAARAVWPPRSMARPIA
jgi:DNA polymerase-4